MNLTCYACGSSVDADGATPPARCSCGEPYWIDSDPAGFSLESVALSDRLWGFEDLLPAMATGDGRSALGGLADAIGGTPCVRLSTLEADVGCRITIKDEGLNPTGSFKDRGSVVGVAAALESGAPAVGTVSHGNMALSTAAVAAAADLPCVVFVPGDISTDRLANMARFDPDIVRVDGDYGRLYYDALAAGTELGIPFVNSDVPLRVAGQKTTVLEILAASAQGRAAGADAALPDAIVMPISSGGHASGAWKAIRELRAAGYGDLPELHFVQAAPCAPVARAFSAGDDEVTRIEPGSTIAYSIANPDPPSGTRALQAARDTGGAVHAVEDDAIHEARNLLATKTGFNVEPASATTLAATRQLADDGTFGPDDEVVIVTTGSGYKERADVDVEAPTVTLEDVPETLRGFSS